MSNGGESVSGASEENADDGPTTVLVIDDEELFQRLFTTYLESAGYEVNAVGSGDAALEAVDEDVDIVLLDRRMPDPSGDDVLAEIRARNIHCRVALVTAVEPDFDIVTIDCDDYLVKPVSREALVDTVERLELLDEYDETRRELSALRVKRNVLEVEKHPSALEENAAFRRLQNEITKLESELDDLEATIDERPGYEDRR